MREGSFKGLAVIGISGGFEIVHHAGARKLQAFAFLLAVQLVGAFTLAVALVGLLGFHLGCYVLTFPTSCHNFNILTHRDP